MRLLVSNPSILVALEQVDLLKTLFALPMEVSVTDFLYERELRNYGGQELLKLGLQIQVLNPRMTTLVTQYCRNVPTLCRDEAFTFVLAQEHNFVLLTINPELVRLAEAKSIDHYPLSSVFNLMLDQSLIAQRSLVQRLSGTAAKTRCPLVRREAEVCLSNLSQYHF